MDKIFAVMRREFIERVRTKAFIIGTVIVPLMTLGFGYLPQLLMQRETRPRNLVLLDAVGGATVTLATATTTGAGGGAGAGAGAATAARRTTCGLTTTGCGRTSATRAGARLKPASRSCAMISLRCAVEVPPITVAITRLGPRCAEAVRLKPAARV